LCDTGLFDFAGLKTGDSPFENGDTAFDKEEFRDPPMPLEDGEEAVTAPARRTISILDSRKPAQQEEGGCGA
jgi:tRNA 2-thiocytidine biosynthesis protein TtcA